MIDNIGDVSLVVQLLSLTILVTTTLTLVVAAFSYASYKLRKRAPAARVVDHTPFFEVYEPRLGVGASSATLPPAVGRGAD